MTENTQENFQGLIPSKEMLEQNKRELENPKGPPLPCQAAEEDFDNGVQILRDHLLSLMMLNKIAPKVALLEAQRNKKNARPHAA